MASCDVTTDISSLDLSDTENSSDIVMQKTDKDAFQKDIGALTVVDVYNIAASIGREFEKLTDAFGGAIFSDVMPKMIRVLEMLEAFAARSQTFSTDVVELQANLQKLQVDVTNNNEKHKEELEIVDTAWRDETTQLFHSIDTLQEDNKRLTELLTEKLEAPVGSQNSSDQQVSVLSMLGESVEKQRDELREKNKMLEHQTKEVDALNSQAERLTKLNVDLRRKVSLMGHQASTLAGENNDLEVTCREKDRQVKELQKRIIELNNKGRGDGDTGKDIFTDTASCGTSDELCDPLLANKLVIDLSDPDRPRYTLQELQDVLNEKNNLKLKCFLQEEELGYYKQNEDQWEIVGDDETSGNSSTPAEEVNNNKPESAIKKLFSSIFSRDAKSSPIPHVVQKPRKSRNVKFDLTMTDFDDVVKEKEMDSIELIVPESSDQEKEVVSDDAKDSNDTNGRVE